MDKFEALFNDVYSVFAKPEWTNENIRTLPENYIAKNLGNEYIRVYVIPGASKGYLNMPGSLGGQLMIDIFVPAGEGLKRALVIAGILNKHLEQKSINTIANNVTQFSTSALNPVGADPVNPSLHRSSYSLPFNFFGI